MSICSIEDVAAAVDRPFWFQLYVMRDRGFVRELIVRAIAANCSALMPTLDLAAEGERYCDVKNGMTVPPEITLANVLDVARRPRWVLSVLKGKRKTFGNLAGRIKGMESVTSLVRLDDSDLLSRQLGRVDKRLVASPDYLERAGTSQTVAELANHRGILTRTDLDHWSIDNQSIRVLWHISTRNMLVTRDAVCAGLGIALVLGFWPTPRSRREVL
jgi:isopentenyl diphosphate isomerase/L-lactate dehydrogenase-like FMN-dependent dehydrogenase